MYLKDLVNEILYEDEKHEFKLRLNENDPCSWLKTVAGFANHIGGELFIGVDDKNQKLAGFTANEADKIRNFFNNQVNIHITPRPSYNIKFIDYLINDQIRYIILISIDESDQKPLVVRFKESPMIFIRRQGFTGGAENEEIQDMVIKSQQNYNFDRLISSKKYDRNDFNLLYEYYYRAHKAVLTEKKLISIGFMNDKYMLSNAGLLFSDKYNENCMLQLCTFNSLNAGANCINDKVEYKCSILQCIEKAINYINVRSNHSIYKNINGRIDVDSYPKQSVLEGIVNAFAHRDYYNNSFVKVDIFSNRVEITSPGKLFKYSGENTRRYDLNGIIPTRRNPLIIDILVMLKLMESAGTGFDKIEQDYINANKFHKPFINYTSNQFMLVLPNLNDEVGISTMENNKISYPILKKRSAYDDEIVNMCYNRTLTGKEIANELGISYSSYLIGDILQNLVDNNILIKTKIARSNYFTTNEKVITFV